jgi:hypothetical protein
MSWLMSTHTLMSNFRELINRGRSMYFYITKLKGLGIVPSFWSLLGWKPKRLGSGSLCECSLSASVTSCLIRDLSCLMDLKTWMPLPRFYAVVFNTHMFAPTKWQRGIVILWAVYRGNWFLRVYFYCTFYSAWEKVYREALCGGGPPSWTIGLAYMATSC